MNIKIIIQIWIIYKIGCVDNTNKIRWFISQGITVCPMPKANNEETP